MQGTWATSVGLDLHLELSGARPRAALESALREAVRGGRLVPGTALPSSRVLAADLRLARNTVADAYAQLIAEGWLAARHGSGTWVAERAAQPRPAVAAERPTERQSRYDLRPGTPDVSAFPRSAWLAAGRRALGAAPAGDLAGYPSPQGLPELRAALAEYLARARGVAVTPERVIVTAGFAEGLDLVCQILRARGVRALAVESYGLPEHREIAAVRGLQLDPVPVDSPGAVLSAEVLSSAGAILLTPAHQFPLGMALAPQRRRQAADWAVRTGGLLIEDDYDGEFRYDRQAVGALQALAPEHIIYGGTASKSLAPGLRLGWLVVPAGLVAEITEAKRATVRLSSSLDQLALAEFIASGQYDRQVRRMRTVYRQRRDRLLRALAQEVPDVRLTGIVAGLQALALLPDRLGEDEVVARARKHGLMLKGLADFRAGEQSHPPGLVLGYATPPAHAFTTAIARLCAVLRSAA
ncbi:MAG TPA: PLP-dependent aminotransferase family protein [Streptosporangiaceae bacterium]